MKKIIIIISILLTIFLVGCYRPSLEEAKNFYTESLKNYQEQTKGNYRVEISIFKDNLIKKYIYQIANTEVTINQQDFITHESNINTYELKDNELYLNDKLKNQNYSLEDFKKNYTMPLTLTMDNLSIDYDFKAYKISDKFYKYKHNTIVINANYSFMNEIYDEINETAVSKNEQLISYEATLKNKNYTISYISSLTNKTKESNS